MRCAKRSFASRDLAPLRTGGPGPGFGVAGDVQGLTKKSDGKMGFLVANGIFMGFIMVLWDLMGFYGMYPLVIHG